MKINTKWLKAAKHPFNILILDSDYVSDAVKRSVFELLEATTKECQTWHKFWMKGKAFFSCMGNNHKVPPSITTNWPPSDRYLQPTGNMHFWMFSPTLWFGKNQVLQNPTNWWASITVSSRISSQWLLQCFQCNCLSSPQTLTRLQKRNTKQIKNKNTKIN